MVFDSVYEMTNYLKSPTVTPTLTFESDFTSTSGWTSTDSKFAINTGQDALIANNDQVTDNLQIGYDLTSISDTAWILDFDLKIVSLTSAGSMWTHIGMFSVNTSVNDDQTQNFLGLILLGENAQGANTNSILLADQQGGSLGGAGILTSGLTLTGTPQYYLRLKRTASNKLTIENYSSSARTGTPSTTVTRTLGDNPQSLRYLKVSNRTVSGSGELNIKIENMKFYNGVTSLLPYPKPRGQHFWEYFSGGSLNSRWTERNGLSGDGTVSTSYAVMADEVNGGVKISSNTGTWGKTTLSFNSIRPFDATASVMIFNGRRTGHSVGYNITGLSDHVLIWDNAPQEVGIKNYSEDSSYKVITSDGTNQSETDFNPTVAVDTSFHQFKIVNTSTSNSGYIDGVLGLSKTTNRPTGKVQPQMLAMTKAAEQTSAINQINYIEVYNT